MTTKFGNFEFALENQKLYSVTVLLAYFDWILGSNDSIPGTTSVMDYP